MTIREIYSEVGGDYNDFFGRIPKEDKIITFVKMYAANTDIQEMISAYRECNYRKVFEKSHNLKGMAANLSLVKMQSIISQICEAVRFGDPKEDISELINQAEKDHELLVSLVNQLV